MAFLKLRNHRRGIWATFQWVQIWNFTIFWAVMLEILEKKNFYMKPPFSVMQPQIAKPGKRYLRIVPRSSDMKFHSFQTDFLHEAPFFRDAASNWEAGQQLFAYCSKDFKYEVSLNLVKGLWRLISLPPPRNFFGEHKKQKCWWPAFSLFPVMISKVLKTKIIVWTTFILWRLLMLWIWSSSKFCCLVKS